MKELPKIYNPANYESDIYHIWESSGYFNPDKLATSLGEPYAIMMPPPNVTGVLHLGHAMENALMDLQIRYQRMLGKKTLLLPGTDHAAVATQARVEKELIASGKYKDPRTELGREKLLQLIKDYADKSRETILKQIRIMGTSCDWSRLAYTFDEQRSAAVNEMFIRMYNDNLIYRGHRIVNWDPKLATTVSDDELVWQEENIPLYYFHFGPFIITTARPETKLGDKYVVVHPDDKRYWKYKHGDTFDCEWINGPVKATVIKDKVIDPEFGTGAMTITPWHDSVDFDIAERHKLDKVQIIGFDGKMLPIAREFAGLSISEARAKIVQKLEKKGLVYDVKKDYLHRVAISDRGNVPVEPQIKLQWFVDVNKQIPKKGKSLKDLMREAVTTGHGGKKENIIAIQPERFSKSYLQWIDNLHDWCISRQIWWGHRIPVWYRTGERRKKLGKITLPPCFFLLTPPKCTSE
ncbi:MAG: class I tRNA ligase family protein [Candidatus Komeilibacteria bacterium]